jgi:transcriptional regulator GlxA family with amidase domain
MNLGIVVFPEVEELDFTGPMEVLSVWRYFSESAPRAVVVAETREPVACSHGLTILPQASFADCPPLDLLLVPGGWGTRKQVDNPALIAFLAERARTCRTVLSVCTGAFLIHRAGLLSGKRATTHWNSLDRLRALGDVTVVEERFVQDGNMWCAAGVAAGIDMAFAFLASTAGTETAAKVQAAIEYFPSGRRYGAFEKDAKAPGYLKAPAVHAAP